MAPAKSVDFPAGADDGCSAPGPNEGGEGHRDDVEAGGTAIAPAPATTMLRPRCQRGRLASLDVFRGITVVVSKLSLPSSHVPTGPKICEHARTCVFFDGRHGYG